MLCISAAYAVTRCLCVCPSVCLSRSWVASKRFFDIFSPSGSQAILVFCAKRDGDIPTGIPLTGASNAGGVGKKRDSERISLHTLGHFTFVLVFCWDQRLRPINRSTLVSAGVKFNQSTQLIIADVIGNSSLISPHSFVYLWVSEKVEWFSLIKT